ncbi:MAG: A/G-specific adenine glycosylase [Acidimicrobiales bacterium]|nr:A/G-specific adenine glycosylase [Acidimicrobiales bacterium]
MTVKGQCADRQTLTEWFELHGRDLPWRHSRDPWTILISETMLQQTQVVRVVERLGPFMERFPSPEAMAAASAGDVITEWSGLGYNRRAVALHRTAQAIYELHGGVVPSALADLLALPGVGPYTARAVRVFAFELDDAVVDTNIGRVLARWENRSLKPAEAQDFANSLVRRGGAWIWNQSIMELGALLCRPQPHCAACPVSRDCGWFLAGQPTPDPASRTAGVTTGQSRFEGSDRQGRGRLMRHLARQDVDEANLDDAMGWPGDPARADRVVQGMVTDGLVERLGTSYRLPA